MKNFHKIIYFLAVCLSLGSCATTEQPVDNTPVTPAVQIEPQKGRISPEISAARALKYNLNTVKQQILPKFAGGKAQQEAFANLNKLREGQPAGLAVSLKELDFAILYTALNFRHNDENFDFLLNQTTSQHLILGALKAHKTTLYGQRKSPELNRLIRQYKKQIEALLKKSPDSKEQLKALENGIDRLNAVQQTLEQNNADFRQLVKVETGRIDVDGRRFFETVALPLKITAADYQNTAFSSRSDLKLFPTFTLPDITQKINNQYSQIGTGVEGIYLQDSARLQNLSAQGDAQASVLLQTMLNYQKAGKAKKEKLLPKLAEEFYKAVYLQVETAFELASRTSADYEIQLNNISEIKQALQKLEKVSRPSEEQRIELLKKKIELIENENLADQILAEKTMTITALRFYNGQLQITPETLNSSIADIAAHLKEAFAVQQKKAVSEENNPLIFRQEAEASTAWAHGENWLETLMAQNPKPASPVLMSKKAATNKDYNQNTTLQLGAFLDKETAEAEWLKLKNIYPELQSYTPVYEPTSAAGIPLFRLQIKSPQGGFRDLCIKLRRDNRECLLRD